MRVLEFETNDPEFKTPIWDYMAVLVDDERVADGKAAMTAHVGALARRRGAVRRRPLCHRGDLGRRVELRPRHGRSFAGRNRSTTLACEGSRRAAVFSRAS